MRERKNDYSRRAYSAVTRDRSQGTTTLDEIVPFSDDFVHFPQNCYKLPLNWYKLLQLPGLPAVQRAPSNDPLTPVFPLRIWHVIMLPT